MRKDVPEMRIRIRHISEPICLGIMIVFPLLFDLLSVFSKNYFIGLEFWAIGLLSVIMIFGEIKNRRSYSVYMFSGFFIYVFVFIAGGYQYLEDSFMYTIQATDREISYANFILILWLIISIIVRRSYSPVLRLVVFIFGIMNVVQNGIPSLFNRYYYNSLASNDLQSITSILKILRSGLGMWTLYICAIDYKMKGGSTGYILFALISCLFLIPPLATSRTIVLITYGGFLLIVSDKLKEGMNFFLFIFALDLFAAPVFNLFRNGFSGDRTVLFSIIRDYKDNFLKSDYDAYSMFLVSIKYVSLNGITWGKQLLSVALFFIPRNIWPSKAIGSGATAIRTLRTAKVSNISCPIFGEAYINFGIIGVFLFAIIVSLFINKIDLLYWNSERSNNSTITNLYPFFVLFILMIFRGDLLNSYSWLLGYIVVLLLIRLVFLKKTVNV